ncbi:MAG: polysaccharide biosynthesis tyrosine autokinase [Bifidobacteriaceae bacterium]|nr:polysaccharide biosynthesis tyrosine autokinase [Bifidobacteriaceae bacterium]
MELSDFLGVLRRFWRSCAIVVCVAAGAAVALTFVLPKQYTAQAKLYVSVMGNSVAEVASGVNAAQNQVDTFRQVATTPFVLERAISELGLADTTPAALAGDLSVSVPTGTSMLVIEVERDNPQSAAQIANAVSASLVDAVSDLATSPAGEKLVSARIVAPAQEPASHSFPITRTFLALGVLAGLVLGAGQALLRFLLDKRVRDESQIEELTDAPIMGRIGLDPQLVGSDRPARVSRITAEDYRRLRTNMQFVGAGEEDRGKTLVITSSLPSEGKSAIAVNLATVLAEAGGKVLLIDGDLRRPRIATYMGLEATVGLTTVLIGWASPGEALQSTRVPNLTVMPSGVIPPNPSELLASRAMKQLLDSAARHFDYTVVDCAPLLPVTDAAILSRQTDGALVVADMQRVLVPQLRSALNEIEQANGTVLGLVLNKMKSGPGSGSTYYGYHEYGEAASGQARKPSGGSHGAGGRSR